MSQKVSADDLASEILKSVAAYTSDVKEDIDQAVREITSNIEQKVVTELSPVRQAGTAYITRKGQRVVAKDNLQPGAYKKGWKPKISEKSNGRIYGTLYNRTNWQLTWLLELGHKAKNEKPVAPSPIGGHIQPANDRAAAALDKKIKEILNK